MYNLYVWIVGFVLAIFSVPLSNLMIRENVSVEQAVLVLSGLILMLLSPKTN